MEWQDASGIMANPKRDPAQEGPSHGHGQQATSHTLIVFHSPRGRAVPFVSL